MRARAHPISIPWACFALTLAACGLDVTGVATDGGPQLIPSDGGTSTSTPAPAVDAPDGGPIVDGGAVVDVVDGGATVEKRPAPSTLALVWEAAPATVDLDVEGTGGWIHWGRSNEASIDRKSAAPNALPDFKLTTKSGAATLLRYTDHEASIKWSAGTPTVSESGTRTGVYSRGDRATFTFRVPVDTSAHRLVLHTNVFKGIGRFAARLESGAAPAVVRDVDAGDGDAYGRTVIDVKAGLATELVVTFELVSPANNERNVAIAAATWR